MGGCQGVAMGLLGCSSQSSGLCDDLLMFCSFHQLSGENHDHLIT